MRLEHIPIVLGVIASLLALVVLYDAASPEAGRPHTERRRRQRAEINVPGEWLVGVGIASLAVSLFGGETWRWTTVAVMTGMALIVVGALLNRAYLREMLLFRGPARRTEEHEVPPIAHKDDKRPLRIR